MNSWFTQLLSSGSNQEPAIGRVLGAVAFINLILLIPGIVAAALWGKQVDPKTWFDFMSVLQVYVPLTIAGVAALIAGTNFTEPKSHDDDKPTV